MEEKSTVTKKRILAFRRLRRRTNVKTPEDADYLLRRSQHETLKAQEAARRGDSPQTIYLHRELAVRYYAQAMNAKRSEADTVH